MTLAHRLKPWLVAAAILTPGACAGPEIRYTSLRPSPPRPPRSSAEIELLMRENPPTRPTSDIGRVEVQRPGFSCRNASSAFTQDESLTMMRDKAAEVGADGVRDVRCIPQGFWDATTELCSGSAFMYR